jgi:hypothetical protein
MLLLIDIFSINKGREYENPSLKIIVTERCSTGGCPLEEALEHCFLNQSVIFVVVLISFMCYCGDYVGYITVILPFLAFYFCSAYFLYLVYYSFGGWESYIDNLLNELTPWCKLPHQAVGNSPRSSSESSQRQSQVQHHLPYVVTLGRKSKRLWPLWYHLLYQSRRGIVNSLVYTQGQGN